MDMPADLSAEHLAYITPWSRTEWAEACALIAIDDRLIWPWVVEVALKTGAGPGIAVDLLLALVPETDPTENVPRPGMTRTGAWDQPD